MIDNFNPNNATAISRSLFYFVGTEFLGLFLNNETKKAIRAKKTYQELKTKIKSLKVSFVYVNVLYIGN